MRPASGPPLERPPCLRIGLISDTHGLLRPEALAALRGAALVIHAGDIGDPAILEELRREVAPVVAVRGNNDTGAWASAIRERETVTAEGGLSIYVLHDLHELELDPAARGHRVVVSGHSHRPLAEERGGVLYVNPGSAGPRRFRLPVAVAMLEVEGPRVRATIRELALGA